MFPIHVGRHAKLTHVHRDGIEVGVPSTKLRDRRQFPACSCRWVLMQEVPSTFNLDLIELKYKLNVLYCLIVGFLPVLFPHMPFVEVLEEAEPGAHWRAN